MKVNDNIPDSIEPGKRQSGKLQMRKYAAPSARIIGIKAGRAILQTSEPSELENGGLL